MISPVQVSHRVHYESIRRFDQRATKKKIKSRGFYEQPPGGHRHRTGLLRLSRKIWQSRRRRTGFSSPSQPRGPHWRFLGKECSSRKVTHFPFSVMKEFLNFYWRVFIGIRGPAEELRATTVLACTCCCLGWERRTSFYLSTTGSCGPASDRRHQEIFPGVF